MADGYLVGQGKISLAPRTSTGRSGGFAWAGDADAFSLTASESFLDFNESWSGSRARVVHLSQGKTAGFKLSLRRVDAINLARAIKGTIGATVTGATVTGEALVAYAGTSTPLAFPGVSAVVISKGGTPLVVNTDYTVDAVSGMVTFLSGSTQVTGTTGVPVTANYTYANYGGTVQALNSANQEFSLRYDGFSQTDGSPIIVMIHRCSFDLASDIALIGSDVAVLSITGAILPAPEITGQGLSQFYTITRGA